MISPAAICFTTCLYGLKSVVTGHIVSLFNPVCCHRALRPIRIATRLDGLRAVVSAMASAVPAVSEVVLVRRGWAVFPGVLGANF